MNCRAILKVSPWSVLVNNDLQFCYVLKLGVFIENQLAFLILMEIFVTDQWKQSEVRRVWRYERSNQNPQTEEEQTTQRPKYQTMLWLTNTCRLFAVSISVMFMTVPLLFVNQIDVWNNSKMKHMLTCMPVSAAHMFQLTELWKPDEIIFCSR